MEQQQQQQQQEEVSSPLTQCVEVPAIRHKLEPTHYYVRLVVPVVCVPGGVNLLRTRVFIVDFVTKNNYEEHEKKQLSLVIPELVTLQAGLPGSVVRVSRDTKRSAIEIRDGPVDQLLLLPPNKREFPEEEEEEIEEVDLLCPGQIPRFFYFPTLKRGKYHHCFEELSVCLKEEVPSPSNQELPTATVVVDFVTKGRRNDEEEGYCWTSLIKQIDIALAKRGLVMDPMHHDDRVLDNSPEPYDNVSVEDGCRRVDIYYSMKKEDYVVLPKSEILSDWEQMDG